MERGKLITKSDSREGGWLQTGSLINMNRAFMAFVFVSERYVSECAQTGKH